MKGTLHVFPSKINNAVFQGLTARDYIAIQAMTGLLAGISDAYISQKIPMPSYESIAKDSYGMADAMLEQSEVKNEQSL